ncbi:MAG TPA: hypothetical protein VMU47_23925 [Caldimonas sp.]|nr:hypothetical protein [Caldimonas sp.]
MSSTEQHRPAAVSIGTLSGVLQAVSGLRERRAIAAMYACLVVGVLVLAVAGRMGPLGALVGAILFMVAMATGINAAGGLQMDAARGQAPRSVADALTFGMLCIPRLLLLALLLLLVVLAVVVALSVLLLICKIPVLGPLLYVVVFPLAVVALGVTVVGLLVCLVLALPAIWEGLGVLRAIAQTLEIVRTRLVEALLLLLLVGLLAFAAGMVVFGVLGAGVAPTMALSNSILDLDPGGAFGSLLGAMQGNGYAIAAGVGGGLLWAAASTLVAQVWLLGLVIVYGRVTVGIDVDLTEGAWRRRLNEARRRVVEPGDDAHAAVEHTQPPSSPMRDLPSGETPPWAPTTTPEFAKPPMGVTPSAAAPVGGGEPPARTLHCPSCAAVCSTEDLFCGGCGQRLR